MAIEAFHNYPNPVIGDGDVERFNNAPDVTKYSSITLCRNWESLKWLLNQNCSCSSVIRHFRSIFPLAAAERTRCGLTCTIYYETSDRSNWIMTLFPHFSSHLLCPIDKTVVAIKCYECTVHPKRNENGTSFDRLCTKFEDTKAFEIDCPFSTMCKKRLYRYQLINTVQESIERGCADQKNDSMVSSVTSRCYFRS